MSRSTGRRIGRTHRPRAALALVAVAFTLGACGGGDESSSGGGRPPDASTSTSTTVATTTGGTPTTTGTTPVTTAPTGGDEKLTAASRLRLDGIGPVKVNMTLDQASAATGMRFQLVEPDLGTDCRYAEAEGGPVGLRFMVIGGHIARVDVSDHPSPSPIATVSGIKIGSTEDEVKAAYRDAIEETGHPYLETGHYLVYKSSDPALGLIFETDGQRVTRFRSGLAGAVQAIEGCA